MPLGANRLAGSLFLQYDDHKHTDRCHTDDVIIIPITTAHYTSSLHFFVLHNSIWNMLSVYLTPAFSLLLSVTL